MRLWIAYWLVALAQRLGWHEPVCERPHLPLHNEAVQLSSRLVDEIEERMSHANGATKAREVLRVLLNRYPGTPIRDLNLLIEVSVAAYHQKQSAEK